MPGQHEGECTINMQTLDLYVVRARRIFALIQTAEDDPETAVFLAKAARRYSAQTEQPEIVGERRSLVTERADAKHALEELYDREEAGDYDDPVGRAGSASARNGSSGAWSGRRPASPSWKRRRHQCSRFTCGCPWARGMSIR